MWTIKVVLDHEGAFDTYVVGIIGKRKECNRTAAVSTRVLRMY